MATYTYDFTLTPPGAPAPVLKDVRFTLQRGRTTAVLGLSGSGKSVLLQVVACRMNLQSFGFAGHVHAPAADMQGLSPMDADKILDRLRPQVAYVPPDDVVFGFDTPREAVVFRHRLAFGSTNEEAEAAAAKLLAELGLEQCADNLIAPGVGLRGISGGQRRRTCIAMALVTRPAILVLDEPTTGLDSNTAKQVMAAVQQLARRYDCAVVQSLQQPGSDLFPFFDDLVMLRADGSLEYTGPTRAGPSSVPKVHREPTTPAPLALPPATHSVPLSPGTPAAATATAGVERRAVGTAPFLTVCGLIVARHYRALLRNPLALLMRVAQALMLALFFGLVFFDMALTLDNMKQVLGFLLVFVSASFVPVQTAAGVFPMEKDVFLEEQKLPYRYPAWVYGMSKFVTESTAQFPLAVVYGAIMGGMIGIPGEHLGNLILSALLQGLAAESFGFVVSTLAHPALAVGVITPVIAFVMMMVGTSLASGQGGTKELFDALKHLAFLRNGFSAVAVDILPIVKGPCSTPGFCFFNDPQEALVFYDLDGTSLGREWGLLVMWAVVFRVAAALSLTAMGWSQRVKYDAVQHRRAPVLAEATSDEEDENGEKEMDAVAIEVEQQDKHQHAARVGYVPEPAPMDLQWRVEFRVRPTFGEGSDAPRTILHDMEGRAFAGRTLAIMGGSGAGKSTLLEALSLRLPPPNVFTETQRDTCVDLRVHRATEPSENNNDDLPKAPVTVSDVGAEARALIAFVHQFTAFIDGLSTREVVEYAAAFAAAGDATEQRALVDSLLEELGLSHAADVPATLLSGSQRKRLAVAAALAERRPILMLDEPTSGLDPRSALQLLTLLHNLARTKRITVMYTLHQPGDELLPFIDDLLLLSAGHVVYHGALADADNAFAGFERPKGVNATDHYLELAADVDAVNVFIDRWKAAHPAGSVAAEGKVEVGQADTPAVEALCAPHAGLRQPGAGFLALIRRSFTATVLRAHKPSLVGRFVALNIIMPLIVGVAMYDQADSVVTVQNAAFSFVMGVSFAAVMTPVMDLHLERLNFLREQESDAYSPVAYFGASTIAALPLDLLGMLVGCGVVYGLVGFRSDAGSFFLFVLAAFLQQQASTGVGYIIGVALHSLVVAAAFAMLVAVVFSTGAGVIVAPQTMDDSRWMTGLEFLAPTRHSMLLMVDEEMRHRPGGEELVKKVLGFDRAWDERWVLWLNLVAVVVAFRVFAALLFKLSTRPKTYRGADNATA